VQFFGQVFDEGMQYQQLELSTLNSSITQLLNNSIAQYQSRTLNNMNSSTDAVAIAANPNAANPDANPNAVAIAANPNANPNAVAIAANPNANPTANPNVIADSFKIEIIDIGKATPVTDRLLQVLQDVYNDSGKYTCHGGTTHIMVLYDNGKVVGGALLRISNRVIVLKRRLCVGVEKRNSIYSSSIIQYVISRYSTYEVHTTTTPESIVVFVANGFEQRRRSLGCLCKNVKGLMHLSWKPVKVVALIEGMNILIIIYVINKN
jgi:hypothetical protein